MLRRRPTRPYADLDDYRRRLYQGDLPAERFFAQHPSEWPCVECSGWGWYYDTEAPPILTEGRRTFPKVMCPACLGSRLGTRSKCEAAFDGTIMHWQIEANKFDRLVSLRTTALGKLNAEEIESLQALGC